MAAPESGGGSSTPVSPFPDARRAPGATISLAHLVTMSMVGALTGALPWTVDDVVGVALLMALTLALGLKAASGEGRAGWWTGPTVLLVALLWRGGAALAQRLYALPPLYMADATMYDEEAWTIAQAWLANVEADVPAHSLNVAAYERLTAAMYLVVGHSALTVQVMGAFMGALAVYYAWRAASELIGPERAGAVACVGALWPSHALWSSQGIRDPWVFFLLARAVWSAISWLKYGKTREWVKAAGFSALVGVFRLSTAMVLGAALLTMSVVVAWRRSPWRTRLALLVFALATVALVERAAIDVGSDRMSLARLSEARQGLATGGAAFFPETRYTSWLDVVRFMPLGALYVLFAPFPWAADSAAQLASALENAVLYCLLGMSLPGLGGVLRLLRRLEGAFVGLLVVGFVGVLALVEGNLGTAYRHKVQFLPYLLALAGAGWPVVRSTRRDAKPTPLPAAVPAAR